MTLTEQYILNTVHYFDVLKKPLTLTEIYRYLLVKTDVKDNLQKNNIPFKDVITALESSPVLQQALEFKRGLYFLRGKSHLLRQRHIRQRISIQRYKRVKKYQNILINIPFVSALFLSGSLSIANSKQTSDIDFFIVAKKGHIWTARFFLTIVTQLLGIRRHGNLEANRFCLNHYVSEAHLERHDRDVYAAQLYSDLISINSVNLEKDTLKEFLGVNTWTQKFFPHITQRQHVSFLDSTRNSKMRFSIIKKLVEKILSIKRTGNLLEHIFRRIQTRKIKRNPKTRYQHAKVGFSDLELQFHPIPNGPRISDELKLRVSSLLLQNSVVYSIIVIAFA